MGNTQSIENTTISWANLALQSGATSLVCSPFEVSALRKLSSHAVLITPGVRVEGDEVGDQVRVMSPKEALSKGANHVVIGRSITNLWDGSDSKMRGKLELISNTLA
jgi:orotidine-5'-phosphate decarboxylase